MPSAFSRFGLDKALQALGLKEEPVNWERYAIPAGAGVGSAALLYALLRKQRLSTDPVLRAIQKASKGKLTGVDFEKMKMFGKKRPEMSDKTRKRIMNLVRGTDETILAPYDEQAIKQLKYLAQEGLPLPAIKPIRKIEGGALHYGDPLLSKLFPDSAKVTDNLQDAYRMFDKLREAEILQKYAPGIGPKTLGLEGTLLASTNVTKKLKGLQKTLQQKFPEGYIIKPRQAGATGDVIQHTDDLVKLLKEKGQRGEWAQQVSKDPSKFIAQERLPIMTEKRLPWGSEKFHPGKVELPVEYRVHTVGGRIVPKAMSRRYPTWGNLNPLKTWSEERQLIREIQPALDKLPEQYRKRMMMALDVAKTPKGFRIIETNPQGAGSGFLVPDVTEVPSLASHHMYQAITGRHSKPMAAGKALLGGGLATAGTAASTAALDV